MSALQGSNPGCLGQAYLILNNRKGKSLPRLLTRPGETSFCNHREPHNTLSASPCTTPTLAKRKRKVLLFSCILLSRAINYSITKLSPSVSECLPRTVGGAGRPAVTAAGRVDRAAVTRGPGPPWPGELWGWGVAASHLLSPLLDNESHLQTHLLSHYHQSHSSQSLSREFSTQSTE